MMNKQTEKKINNIKNIFVKNLLLKVLSLAAAIILWMVVINISDPEITRTFTSVVTITNESVLTSTGKYYSIPNNANTVSFKVSAKRSIIEKLTGSDFTATADMRELEDNVRIPVEIVPNKMASQVTVNTKQYYINISVETQMSTTFAITAATSGTPAEGCVVQEVKANPEFIDVTGREVDVNKIDKVVATVDVSGRNSDISAVVLPVFYDAEGNVIDTTNLDISVATVEVLCDLTNIKTVPITIETSGELDSKLELDEIKAEPGTVVVQGNRSVLNSLTSITVPGDVINLSTVTGDFSTTVDIISYLPDGVTLNDASKSLVKISVVIARPVSKTFMISPENISIKKLSDKYEAAIKESGVEVTITGITSKIEKLDAAKITGYIDADGLSTGSSVVPVEFNLSDSYKTDDVTVTLVLREKRTSPSGSGTTVSPGNSDGGSKPDSGNKTDGGTSQGGSGQDNSTSGTTGDANTGKTNN